MTTSAGVDDSPARWFGDSLRKVHTLYVSPPWAHGRGDQFDAEQTVAQLARAGVNTIELYAKDHHGVCYFPCPLGLDYPRDIVGELSTAAKRHGMRFIAYFSVGFDNYALGVHPEWRATDRQGEARRQPPFWWACLQSPYRDFALTQLRELITHVSMDGLWLDIVPFAWDTAQAVWMQTTLPAPCYCPSCQAAFQRVTGYPLPWGEEHPPGPVQRAAYQFLLAGVRDFLEEVRTLLHVSQPDALITYNGANGPGDPLALGDLVSIEGHAPHYVRQSFIGAWARASGHPFEILTAGGLPSSPGGWNGYDQKPPAVLRIEAAIAAAHGGSAVIGHAPLPNGATDGGQYTGFAAAFQQLQPVEAAGLVHPASMAEVAVALLPTLDDAPEAWTRALDGAEAAYHALLNDHFQVDMIRGFEHAHRYRVVVIADQLMLSDADVAALEQFVDAGGALLVIGMNPGLSPTSSGVKAKSLDHLLGIKTIRRADVPFAYLRLHDAALAADISNVPLLVNADPLIAELDGATALANLVLPETGRTDGTTVLWGNPPPDEQQSAAGITLHQIGNGQAMAVTCSLAANHPATGAVWATRGLEAVWLRQLMQNAVRRLLPDPLLTTTAPPGVVMVLNRHGNRLALHVIDTRSAAPEYLIRRSGHTQASGWTVSINQACIKHLRNIRSLDGEQPVMWDTVNQIYLIHLPPVDQYLVLVLETNIVA